MQHFSSSNNSNEFGDQADTRKEEKEISISVFALL